MANGVEWKPLQPSCSLQERWLPGVESDGRSVAVFATPAGQGVVSPQQLARDLDEELAKY
jgi:hypothetical protein